MPTLLLFLTLLLYPLPAFSACDLRSVEFVRRDVLIFGGGSSGTYAAVKLRDSGKSVMIIESKRTLGGHAETWTDPITGYTIDAGATVFPPVKRVKDYFSRWGVELSKARAKVGQKYVDFETGIEVNFQPTDTEDFEAALRLYENQLDKHPGLQNGFNLTDPVHPDLLLSFRDFIEKYKLQDLASTIFRINQGLVPLLDVSMLYVFKSLNKDQLLALRKNYLTTSRHNIRALYQKIADFLGPNVLLDTRVIDISRSTDREYDHRVLVNTTKSCRTILAGQLLVTMPPIPNERSIFPLSGRERDLFYKFHAGGYYSAILKNTGLNASLLAADPSKPFGVPTLPGLYDVKHDRGFTQVHYGSPTELSEEEVKKDILASLRRARKGQGLWDNNTQPEWLAFYNHAPFNLMVSNDEIRSGFYRKLDELQGIYRTFYTGAAWQTHDSNAVWQYTDDVLLPRMLA